MQKSELDIDSLREAYLSFFEQRQHARLPSAPLVPENDPTTLFTGSGMQPMVPYLLGQPHPSGRRLTDSQKCFRVNDIEEVGDNRHTTFFEMLGNWSLGDYFKAEQIPWMFEFLTKTLQLDPKRIYVTVFTGNDSIGIPRDDESVKLWQTLFSEAGISASVVEDAEQNGLQGGRIFYYGEEKNWWSRAGAPKAMPEGEPGGPDTEMFWDFGAERGFHEQSPHKNNPCHVNCDCGRFLEIGNNVFMQYVKTKDGFADLPQKNVDFGGGLERMLAALEDNPDMLTIGPFQPMRQRLESISGKSYGANEQNTRAFRIIMDHIRAATFLIADEVLPSNKDQGYFVRRLIRRSVRFAHNLGIGQPFCADIGGIVIRQYESAYPQLGNMAEAIAEEFQEEEKKFRKTLELGLKSFEQKTTDLKPGDTIPTEQVFDLYQSFGFPFEMSQELAQEKKLRVDEQAFQAAFEKHQKISRAGAEKKFKGGLADHSKESIHYHTATHLLHQALRTVLGEHVYQKGSNITKERLRFDFSHPDKMTSKQLAAVENIINEKISAGLPVEHEEMSVEEAKQKGALGLFEDKYRDTVSVYTIGDFSCEICGGPHVANTSELGTFKIKKEESASRGVRRIKAVLL